MWPYYGRILKINYRIFSVYYNEQNEIQYVIVGINVNTFKVQW
jgi:hypothetical protein